MSIQAQLAKWVGKGSRWFLTRFTQGGSALPGKLAHQIDPNILQTLAKDYQVVIITGTNGKTLTTSLIVEALKNVYPHVITNPTGSNMEQGIISTFLAAPRLKANEKGIAILEVDEGSLKNVVADLKPDYFVFTNVFRDQLDRFGEIHTVYRYMTDAAMQAPQATVVTNGDLPMFNSFELPNPEVYYGFNHLPASQVDPHYNTDGLLCPKCDHVLRYKLLTYGNLGAYYCEHCDFERPQLTYQVDRIDELALDHSRFTIEGQTFNLPIAGLYNIYNALSAYALLRELGLDPLTIDQGFQKAQRVFGRQEEVLVEGKKALLNLVKNPVGFNQILDIIALDPQPYTLVTLMNNQHADGTDISWIWDVDLEKAQDFPIHSIISGGDKAEDMTKRLVVAGFDPDLIQEAQDMQAVLQAIQNSKDQRIHVLATYTAMLNLREALTKNHYLKHKED